MFKTLSDCKKYSEEKPSLLENSLFWSNVKKQFNPSLVELNELNWFKAVEKLPFNTVILINRQLTMSDEFIKTLLDRFDNFFTPDEKGCYLHRYCKQKNICMVQYLLDKNANPNLKTGINLETPLHTVCSIDIARLLLKYNADPNIKNIKGNTCLYSQIRFSIWNTGNTDIVCLLLKYGANLDIQNNNHETPMHYIIQLKPSVLCLLHRKTSLSATTIEQRRNNLMLLLLKNKANPNIYNKKKHTVLYYATNKHIQHLLLSWGAK
jgi:ankyrin repeat protein